MNRQAFHRTARRLALIFLVGLSLSSAVQANGQISPESLSKVSLVSEVEHGNPGQTTWIGLRIELEKGWHTYWRNPGDAGFPAKVTWGLPKDFSVGNLFWPAPRRFEATQSVTFGYEDGVLLMAPLQVPINAAENSDVQIRADVRWLICKEACIPYQRNLQWSLPIRKGKPKPSVHSGLFQETRKRLPQAVPAKARIEARKDDGHINLSVAGISGAAEGSVYFFPALNGLLDVTSAQKSVFTGTDFTLKLPLSKTLNKLPLVLEGVLKVKEQYYSLEVAMNAGKK